MATRSKSAVVELTPERTHFNLLLLANPNHFGNLEGSTFQAVLKKPMIGNTTFEEIECVGFNPQSDLLDAVIDIKQNSGYSGDLCHNGSLEYVRFYADFGGGWQDLGYSSVRVHDIAGDKPLCYHAKLGIDPPRKFCTENNLVKVRAILSWQAVPPPNTPNYNPVWGSRSDVTIQIRPVYKKKWSDVITTLSDAQFKLSDAAKNVLTAFDPDAEVAVAPQILTLAEKQQLAGEAKIPLHRFAFEEVQKAITTSAVPFTAKLSETALSVLKPSQQAITDLIGIISKPASDTSFEQVRCVAMRPEDDTVSAVLTIKKGAGYSGGLCTNGSTEYIAFYIDIGGWHHLGTAAVQVHDLGTVPADGVQYTVVLPVNISQWLKACPTPVLGNLRAILQWASPPPPNDPNYVPHWGNHEDCLVQLRPGDPGEALFPSLLDISSVPADTASIDPATGLTTAGDQPFGGLVAIRGRFAGFIDRQFKIVVTSLDTGTVKTLTNPVTVRFAQEDLVGNPVDCAPGPPFNFECSKTIAPAAGDVWYPYVNSQSGGVRSYLVDNTLGYWITSAADEGKWEIKVVFRDVATLTEVSTQTVVVRIDNTAPTVHADFTGAGQCGKFKKGNLITGSYQVHDPGSNPFVANPALAVFQHFGAVTAIVIPGLCADPVNLDGSGSNTRSYPAVPTTGINGSWQLTTNNCDPCGYAIRFIAWDRTIYGYLAGANFNVTSLQGEYDLGFCLDLP